MLAVLRPLFEAGGATRELDTCLHQVLALALDLRFRGQVGGSGLGSTAARLRLVGCAAGAGAAAARLFPGPAGLLCCAARTRRVRHVRAGLLLPIGVRCCSLRGQSHELLQGARGWLHADDGAGRSEARRGHELLQRERLQATRRSNSRCSQVAHYKGRVRARWLQC